MELTSVFRLSLAYCFTILPYMIFLVPALSRVQGTPARLFTAASGATALACLFLTAASSFNVSAYYRLHSAILAGGVVLLIFRFAARKSAVLPRWTGTDSGLTVLVLAACAVRLLPIVLGNESMGGGDARFHNILARSILIERRLPGDWLPFAPVPVNYPLGTHALTAFLAETAGVEVHDSFNFLFPVAGALTVAVIYALGLEIFNRRKCAFFAAAAYGFLPFWGSLEYYRWGGLPNALAMLFLCTVLLAVLRAFRSGKGGRLRGSAAASVLLASVAVTHHYTLIAGAILITAGIIFTDDRNLRKVLIWTACGGLLLSLPALLTPYALYPSRFSGTSIMMFEEPLIGISHMIMRSNPLLATLFVAALAATRRTTWTVSQLLIYAWFGGLLAAFICLEYFYRGLILALTGGSQWFTCLTPSRMATDLVYPAGLLSGFVPLTGFWRKHRGMLMPLLITGALVSSAASVRNQYNAGVSPHENEASRWIEANTPPDSFVIGNLPHLEYLSWRETSNPPLPASEQRRDPRVTWRKEIRTVEGWLDWSETSGRRVYFIFGRGNRLPDNLRAVFSNEAVIIASPVRMQASANSNAKDQTEHLSQNSQRTQRR
ncbi:MAG: hypothetical protein R6V03_04830 [Kiritimatiellia bacterium]